MDWTGRRVLVTGAGGFIGSHLVEALVHQGAAVTALMRYRSTSDTGPFSLLEREVRQAVRVVRGDLRDPEATRRAVARQDVVFHLGALVAIPYSYVNPVEVAETNVAGTLNMLVGARDAGVIRFVQMSTSEVYGSARQVPIDETHVLHAQSPYAATKIGADALATSFQCTYRLPVVIARPFNVYGPRQSGRAVIPAVAGQALRDDVVRVGTLTPTRDFTFVSDTVAGLIALAATDDAIGRTVNLGSGREISIGALVDRIIGLAGRGTPVVQAEERVRPVESEVDRLLSDSSLARRLTGWAPAVGLDEGLRRVVDFLRERPDWTSPGYQI